MVSPGLSHNIMAFIPDSRKAEITAAQIGSRETMFASRVGVDMPVSGVVKSVETRKGANGDYCLIYLIAPVTVNIYDSTGAVVKSVTGQTVISDTSAATLPAGSQLEVGIAISTNKQGQRVLNLAWQVWK